MVISDSRFGCWSRLVPTVFVSHQTNILMPPSLKWLEPFINFFNRLQIKKFTVCWIPDFPSHRITGNLTKTYDLNVRFIGMLSRFDKSISQPIKKYDYLILISGPEPQRTVFEELMRDALHKIPGKKIMVKGQPQLSDKIIETDGFEEVGHLRSDQLQKVIVESEFIFSRSGYTTVMDLAVLKKKVFFVPTPGQTEQEELAAELEKRKIAFYQHQHDFDFEVALYNSINYTGFTNFAHDSQLLQNAMTELLTSSSNV